VTAWRTFYECIKLKELEGRIQDHDEQIVAIFDAIRRLMTPPDRPKKKIGFEVKESGAHYGKSAKKKLTINE